MAANKSAVGENGVRAQDFLDFLSKSESNNRLI